MEPVREFLEMGGHGVFVWSAFGAAALVMTALLAWSIRDLRRQRELLDSLPRRRSDTRSAKARDDP